MVPSPSSFAKLINDILIAAVKTSVQAKQILTFIDAEITRLSNSNIIQIALGMKHKADQESAILCQRGQLHCLQ